MLTLANATSALIGLYRIEIFRETVSGACRGFALIELYRIELGEGVDALELGFNMCLSWFTKTSCFSIAKVENPSHSFCVAQKMKKIARMFGGFKKSSIFAASFGKNGE